MAGDGAYNPTSNDDFDVSEVFGISVGTTFGGADVEVAYAKNLTYEDDSLGFKVAYPFGPVTLGAFYVLGSVVTAPMWRFGSWPSISFTTTRGRETASS